MLNSSFNLLKTNNIDTQLLKKYNILNILDKPLIVRGDLYLFNLLQKEIFIKEQSNVYQNVTQESTSFENVTNETLDINVFEQDKLNVVNSNIEASMQNNSIGIKSKRIELNSNGRLNFESGIIFEKINDDYKESKKIIWNRFDQQFKIVDENNNRLKVYFNPDFMTNIFLKKSGDTMLGSLYLKDIAPSTTNHKTLQNLKYFRTKIDPKYNHSHNEYICKNGESDGVGSGTIENYVSLGQEPTLDKHQQSKEYVDTTLYDKITLQHPEYITFDESDLMDEDASLLLSDDVLITQTNHAQTLKYFNDKFNDVVASHNHNEKYIDIISETPQIIKRIPRLDTEYVLSPQETNIKHSMHIQSKQYQDYFTQNHINGSLFITYQHYYLGDCFSSSDISTDPSIENGMFRLKFNFVDWYNEFNNQYKIQMNTSDDFNQSDFAVIPIITPSSFEIPTSEKIHNDNNRNWFENDPYYDIRIENISYPIQNNRFNVQFDIGITPISETGNRTISNIQVNERSEIPMQSFTIMFIGGPINLVINQIGIPSNICSQSNTFCYNI